MPEKLYALSPACNENKWFTLHLSQTHQIKSMEMEPNHRITQGNQRNWNQRLRSRIDYRLLLFVISYAKNLTAICVSLFACGHTNNGDNKNIVVPLVSFNGPATKILPGMKSYRTLETSQHPPAWV